MNSENNNLGFEASDVTETNNTEPARSSTVIPKKRVPLVCKILYGIAFFCVILYALFVIFPSFSDFFNKHISIWVRGGLSKLTDWIPFSLSEFLLLCIPLILIAGVSYGIKHYSSSWRDIGVFCIIVFSLAAYIFSTFTLGFIPAYRGTSLDVKMGLDKKEVSAEELRDTALILSKKINQEIDNIISSESGSSVMPYSYEEMNEKLMFAYTKACRKYDFIQSLDSNIKRIMLSEPMTYTHISGVYTFFTGEANLNTNYPQYTQPYTAAHEFAHQRGIAREDEANFVAFLVCADSNDSYIRYSAYLNLYEYVASALYQANPQYYSAVYYTLPNQAKAEMAAYSEFFDKYRDSVVSEASNAINDLYLNANGDKNGTKSYGLVVDLAVAYYKEK